MKRFGRMVPVAALATGILLPGCATTEPEPATTLQLERMTESEREAGAKKVAETYMTNFTTAFREKDIEKFKQVISEERRQKLTPEVFEQILVASKSEQGEFVDMKLVAVLDQVIYQTFLWKMTYEKQDSDGNPFRRDYLYFVSVGKTGESEYAVGAAGFRL